MTAEDYPQCFLLLFGLLVHTADLYSPTKPVAESLKWVELVNAEFKAQLQEEKVKGYKVSTFFENLDLPLVKARGETFFISTFIHPLWTLADRILEGALNQEIQHINANLAHWKGVIAEETAKQKGVGQGSNK